MDVVTGRPFAVILADRPGSGHAWSCPELPAGITLIDTRYLAEIPREVGSPRDKEFRLVAERSGVYTLVFELRRSWEATPVQERVVHIKAHHLPAIAVQATVPIPKASSCAVPKLSYSLYWSRIRLLALAWAFTLSAGTR